MSQIEQWLAAFADFMWGPQLVVLLVGGGLYFTFHSRLRHVRYLGHSVDLLRGKYQAGASEGGDISHYRALATALAGTIGVGNITGVAVAITLGGAGRSFLDVGDRAGRDFHQVLHRVACDNVSRH